MTRPRLPILVAGAGIGGLAAALALARRGFAVHVLEKGALAGEAGAGIQLAPNATRVLVDLGVLDRLKGVGVEPESLRLRDGASGRLLVELPLGAWLRARHGAPYRLVHRADLANALAASVAAEPSITVTQDFDVREVMLMGAGVSTKLDTSDTLFRGASIGTIGARSARGDAAFGDALIGADGLWSQVRTSVTGGCRPEASGWTAWRALIDWSAAEPQFQASCVNAWLAPHGHVVHYPIRAGREIAAVVVTKDGHLPAEPEAETRLPALAGFSPELYDFLALAPTWRRWPLHAARPGGAMHCGRIALLGDAAHPLVPYLAQGAAMALEDAVVLAASLAAKPDDIPAAFAAYAAKRRARLARVAAASRRNGRLYHLGWPLAPARNAVLRLMPPQRLMAGFDWLYGN